MKRVLLFLLVVIALFLGYAATRPDTFHVARSITIAAPPQAVYDRVADFHQWASWSAWDKLDPNMTKEYTGTNGTVGAAYSWKGNDKVGEGRMTMIEAQPPQEMGVRLDFIKPFQGTSTSTFTFSPEGAGTKVTWSMDGKNNFIAKVMSVFVNMDKEIGKDFDKGLGTLKTLIESAPAEAASAAPAGQPSGAAPH